MQLQQILFSQGFGTRRVCAGLVEQGFVTVQGQPCTDPYADFEPNGLRFSVQGRDWVFHEKAYLALHKPAGYECSQKPGAWPSVYTLLPAPLRQRPQRQGQPGVQAIGRLDQDTTGLLLLSDDGAFIHRMGSPKRHVPKVYEITARHPVDAAMVRRLLEGVVLDDDPRPVRAAATIRFTWWYLPSVSVSRSPSSPVTSQAAARTGRGSSSSTTPSSRRRTIAASTGCRAVIS